jgi:hypothetical protein
MSRVKKSFVYVRDWYGKYEGPISSLTLFGGFAFDAITLKRVDMFWENFWVIVHLLIVGVAIVLINWYENKGDFSYDASSPRFWYVNIMQFFFGGLLSTFLVFYFRSSDIFVSWPFMLLLVAAFLMNERLKRHFERVAFQVTLFYLSLYCFAIFIIPVLVHRIGSLVFIFSGVVSLVLIRGFIGIIHKVSHERSRKSAKLITTSVLSVFLAINVLYFANLIPPIPLSLKEAGAYHSIVKNGDGTYTVEGEHQGLMSFFKLYETIHLRPGDPVYVLSAVFSPSDLDTTVVHEWQKYDSTENKWNSVSKIAVEVQGGREEGWRTFTTKTGLTPGIWKVMVETPHGQVIGTLRFKVISGAPTNIKTELK